ncbi:HNH endonuclease [Paraglaciecola sp. 25GB23A]|uniref:HNH endonuclease n=1 Tax=Paraglaciecola sp. 25GB23A TaxID=3156068 RepID=UPI0032AE8596
MKYWWVSHSKTCMHEISGGFLWSPKTNRNGGKNPYYDNMKMVMPGDIVYSFAKTKISAIGIIQSKSYNSNIPKTHINSENEWIKDDGWRIDVEFHKLDNVIRPSSHLEQLKPVLPSRYSPINPKSGRGNQAYLFPIEGPLANVLNLLIGEESLQLISGLNLELTKQKEEESILTDIETSTFLNATEKEQLVKSRIGQGIFRTRVEKISPFCPVTKISEKPHLIASHIKPWRYATNKERLDGNNGLLLAPHIDHLFDKGYITFNEHGEIIFSKELSNQVQNALAVKKGKFAKFNDKQAYYMKYHRENIFKSN